MDCFAAMKYSKVKKGKERAFLNVLGEICELENFTYFQGTEDGHKHHLLTGTEA